MKILFLCTSKEATLKYRALLPAKYLGADTTYDYTDIPYELKLNRTNVITMQVRINANVLGKTQIVTRSFNYYDVVVFQFPYLDDEVLLIKKLKKLGVKVILDYDDDMFNDNPFYKQTYSLREKDNMVEALKICDLVTVTTESLAETYGKYNQVKILPNMIDLREYPICVQGELANILIHRKAGNTVGWYSSGIRYEEFNSIMEGWIPEEVNLFLAGSLIFDNFKHKRLEVTDRFNPADLPKILSNIDIGLIPLSLCKFNNGKSDLKGLEYGAMSIPFIASPTDPYKKLIKHGKNGLLAKHGRDWTKYIQLLVNDSKLRYEMGKEARKVSELRDIKLNIHKWEEAYYG